MNPGADIDIVTLRPKAESRADKEQIREAEAKARDERHAGFMTTLNSPGGQHFISLVESRLDSRIEQLVTADPEAQSYVKLLADMGERVVMARRAVKAIVERSLKLAKSAP